MKAAPGAGRDRGPAPRRGAGVTTGLRVAVVAVVGVLTAAGLAAGGLGAYSPAIAWDVAVAVLLVWVWVTVWPMDDDDTAAHATREDPTRPVADVVLLAAAVVSLAAVGFFLLKAASAKGAAQDLLAGVGVATVALSWLLVHTVFTLRYAMLLLQRP